MKNKMQNLLDMKIFAALRFVGVCNYLSMQANNK